MGLLQQGHLMLLPLIWIMLSSPKLLAQSPGSSSSSRTVAARSLDALLQDYAYRAFVNPRTGIPFDGNVPSNLTGIKVSALRLRSGSLRTRGVSSYKEFKIPVGVIEQPYVERLVFVYQNLGNWSMVYYPLPGYTYLTSVVGLLAYDATNLSATNLPELVIQASGKPILVQFRDMKSIPEGSIAKCVSFGLEGSPVFSNASDNMCSTVEQGHFSIVIESIAPSPAPLLPPPLLPPPPPKAGTLPRPSGGGKKDNSKVWKIVGSVLGGLVLLVLLGLLVLCARKYKQRKHMQQMETAADAGEALQMTSIGNTRAPMAMGTRTQPVIEHDYVP